MARQKDIQFASRADSHIARQKQIHRLRHVIRELHKQMPAAKQADPVGDGTGLLGLRHDACTWRIWSRRASTDEDHTKDIDFTPAGIRARRQAGYADTLAHDQARALEGGRQSIPSKA